MEPTCTIIGGGIQAASTGVLLESLGIDTQLISREFAYLTGEDVPTVASNYASASVFPVAVETEESQEDLIEACEASFKPFHETGSVPVRTQTHYYLYEEPRDEELAVPPRMDAQHVSTYNQPLPTRRGESISDGYVCTEYMVEMPEYMPLLFASYAELGGELTQQQVSREYLDSLPGEYIINCTGYGSRDLFNDDSMRAMKGHILQVPYDGDAPLEFSYTYTPRGKSEYTYMYPRTETLVFDGSYLPGDIIGGTWQGESPENPLVIDGEPVPERLVTVNEDIMRNRVEFTRDDIAVKYGFRPYREDGVRIEQVGDVIHNYGHGGAGVSLSWVSAKRVAEYIADVPSGVLGDVSTALARVNNATDTLTGKKLITPST